MILGTSPGVLDSPTRKLTMTHVTASEKKINHIKRLSVQNHLYQMIERIIAENRPRNSRLKTCCVVAKRKAIMLGQQLGMQAKVSEAMFKCYENAICEQAMTSLFVEKRGMPRGTYTSFIFTKYSNAVLIMRLVLFIRSYRFLSKSRNEAARRGVNHNSTFWFSCTELFRSAP